MLRQRGSTTSSGTDRGTTMVSLESLQTKLMTAYDHMTVQEQWRYDTELSAITVRDQWPPTRAAHPIVDSAGITHRRVDLVLSSVTVCGVTYGRRNQYDVWATSKGWSERLFEMVRPCEDGCWGGIGQLRLA